ncbi:hypothetical protein DM01DRAFT_1335468 [Hesseltinella vesiculosa]|uniref:Uncharacterized protein n=1 Tax=Hesseltinella vesiculosa TaxID=101127 RepID=A0A1X2GJN7_9FUNG|nr:hypothetical protein DM01DRAFT_1335468 [Hesseltinella vesiculosa]
MPKLKYKSKRSSRDDDDKKKKKKKKKKKRHHSHERYYSPPYIYEEEHQDLPWSNATKDDEDRAWREKLFDAMADDQPDVLHSQFYEDARPSPHAMDDDEYAAYIQRGMFEKKYAKEIAHEKRKEEHRQRRKREREEAQRRLEQDIEKERLRYEAQLADKEHEHLREHLSATRATYDDQWQQLQESLAASDTTASILKRHIPWPSLDPRRITKTNVQHFLSQASSKELRQVQLRYHPDKFLPRLQAKFAGPDKDWEWVKAKDHEVSAWLNDLWTSRASSKA